MSDTSSPSQRISPQKLAFLGAVVLAAIVAASQLKDVLSFEALAANREALLAFRDSNYLAMSAGFVLFYVLIVAFSLPGATVASVTGGFLFGLTIGTTLNVLSATLGAVAIFLAARWGFGAALSARLNASKGRVGALKKRLAESEVSVLLLLRLVPAVPFFVANLLPALVGVRFFNYLWTTAVGIVPGALVFTSIGVGVGDVFARGETPDLSVFWSPQVIGPLLGLCVLVSLPMIVRMFRGKKDI